MTMKEAIETLKTDCCYECSHGCESAYSCTNKYCPLREATITAIVALKLCIMDGLANERMEKE